MKEMTPAEKVANIRETIYPIICEIDDFCRERKIRYFLCAGTCLGAVRHHGFIPWDDDADLMMPRDDYDRFIREYAQYGDKKYRIGDITLDKGWDREFCRVWNDTTHIRFIRLATDVKLGVFVDIFPIDGFPENALVRRLFMLRMKLLSAIGSSSVKVEFFEGEKYRFIKKISTALFRPLGMRFFAERMDRLARRYPYRTSKLAGVGIAPGYGAREINRRSVFEGEKRILFVDRPLPVPAGYEEYLTNLYGNYMEIPKGAAEKGYTHLQDWEIDL